jgi:raffinose/stachyose/melibiose transport system permease protein
MSTTTTATTTTPTLTAAATNVGAAPASFAVDPDLPRKRPSLTHYLMVIPPVLLFTVFIVVPAIQGAFYSFTNYAGYGAWHMVGFANYKAMFQDPAIRKAYGFTFLFGVVTTVLVNVVALFLAVLLNSKIRWPNWWRGVYFLPMVLSGLVVAFCFQYLLNQSIPQFIHWGPLGTGLLSNETWAWTGVVFVTAWIAFPSAVIIYLAGLSSIGSEIYEAGELDGATPKAQFRRLTLPLLAPFIIINTVLGLKGLLGAYDIIVGLTGGGPAGATTSISMSIVNTINNSDFAYGSAQAMVFFLVTIVLSLLQLLLVKKIGQKS